jgi:hypothetical protein
MPTAAEALDFRDCPWCGAKLVSMDNVWSCVNAHGVQRQRNWIVHSCKNCAGLVATEVLIIGGHGSLKRGGPIPAKTEVQVVQTVPPENPDRQNIAHLPDDVSRYFRDAIRVLDAGVPDAAAVQLRKTLEAASAHNGINKGTLVNRIQELIEKGFVTKGFADALNHVRKIGNIGAHHNDEHLDQSEVERVLKFTTQILRNLFEVPGELAELNSTKDSTAEQST